MKQYFLSPFTAILTFLLGIAVTFSIILLTPPPNLESPKIEKLEYSTLEIEDPFCELEKGEIEIKYDWSLMGKDSLDGIFEVTNNTSRTIYYRGYEENDHQAVWIKQNGKLESVRKFSCWFGVKLQELKSAESRAFYIPVPQNNKPFEAGFDFLIGNKQEKKTVWVKVSKQRKSYTGYQFEDE